MLLQFLAGLSPLAHALSHTKHPLAKNGSVTIDVIHQIFEANKIKVHQQTLTFCENIFHPYQYYMLGSIISNAHEWQITITFTKVKDIQMFVTGISTCKEGYKLSLHIQMNHLLSKSKDSYLLELCSVPIIFETLEFKDSSYGSPGSSSINHLKLTGILFHINTTEKIELFLMNSPSTTRLTVDHCKFNHGILPRKQASINIKKLHLCHFRREWRDVTSMLKENKTLRDFHVTCEVGFTHSLAESLCANDTLKRLVLECVRRRFHPKQGKIYFELELPWGIEETSAKIIMENTSLAELSVLCYSEYSRVGSDCTLGKALCENHTLEKLELVGVSFTVQGAVAFASMLNENTSLKELTLDLSGQDSELIDILLTLSSSLTRNTTLLKLCITLPPASIQHCDEVISACEKDSRLHIE